jgi:LmbE family N-acetylglucosaminyl deacetylase
MAVNVFHKKYLESVLGIRELSARRAMSELPGGRTLVLSPHYDDEVIGSGGTIMTQLSRGHRIRVVYLTDGREGIPEIVDGAEVEKIRRMESGHALEILGVKDSMHLSAPETRLRPDSGFLRKLIHVVREFSPELILIPWLFDNHVDHVEANRILLRVEKELEPNVLILAYEVWTPLVPNLYVDITRFAREKRRALFCFTSQLQQVDYMRTSMALGRRRALEQGFEGYSEAFLCLPVAEYTDLIRKSGIASMKFVKC